ncbi:MAG: antibiotic biosynthesis monooxygenase [Actinobacteria bacterium]|nr:antibiotic biosynthesis monooxygenase [Actinomycetota bacterium]
MATVTKGLLLRAQAKPGREEDVLAFLEGARPIVEDEPDTRAWFAIRFGDSEFGIFDVFPDDSGRQAHLNGGVGQALQEQGDDLFAQAPSIEQVDVISSKLPD